MMIIIYEYKVSSSMIFSFWFKLRMTESSISALLDDSLVNHTDWQKSLRISEEKFTENLYQNYLIRLYQYIINKLVRQFIKFVIDIMSIKFVLISSANWNKKYKDNLMKSINFISQTDIDIEKLMISTTRLILISEINWFYIRNQWFHSQTDINTRNQLILYQKLIISQ